MKTKLKLATVLLGSMYAHFACAQTPPQTFPSKPIRVIVPYATGGVTDQLARVVSARVADLVGQPVVVDNRPGASTIIGMDACAKAAPDGHTLCLTVPDSLSYNPQLFANLPYDPEKDFAPVINLAFSNNLLVAHGNAPFNNYKAMIAHAKANPGKLNWGTWGLATLPDVYLKWVSAQTGINIQAIHYKGSAQSNPAVYAGEVDILYMGFGTAAPQLKAGRIKPLVAIGTRRSSFMPDLPTLGEEGGDPGLSSYFGVWATGGTPRATLLRLNSEFARAVRTQPVQDFFKTTTMDTVANSVDEFNAFVKADRETAAKVFKVIGIKPTAAPQ
ncbi:MAG: Bug family tripartite tricarboxylate transporter substrate binding protein [Burkholderiales bacterium]